MSMSVLYMVTSIKSCITTCKVGVALFVVECRCVDVPLTDSRRHDSDILIHIGGIDVGTAA